MPTVQFHFMSPEMTLVVSLTIHTAEGRQQKAKFAYFLNYYNTLGSILLKLHEILHGNIQLELVWSPVTLRSCQPRHISPRDKVPNYIVYKYQSLAQTWWLSVSHSECYSMLFIGPGDPQASITCYMVLVNCT